LVEQAIFISPKEHFALISAKSILAMTSEMPTIMQSASTIVNRVGIVPDRLNPVWMLNRPSCKESLHNRAARIYRSNWNGTALSEKRV
jgi:hypothetical protein